MKKSQGFWRGETGAAILLDLDIFGGDIKAKKSRGVPQVAEFVYSTKLKKKKKKQRKHSIYKPSH